MAGMGSSSSPAEEKEGEMNDRNMLKSQTCTIKGLSLGRPLAA